MASTSELTILINAKDQASAVMAKVGNSVNKSLGGIANVAKVAGAALLTGGAAAAGFGAMAIKAAAGAQAEMAKFETTMKNTKGATEKARNTILEAANAVVKLGFDDEDAANSMAQLYQRTGDVTKALKLNSLAMDFARAKNISLEEASKAVQMVLSGNGKALKIYGIDLKDAGTPMAALIELQKKLKGSAEEYAKTFTGQMEILKGQMSNLMETIGDKMLPILTSVMVRVNDFASNILPIWIEKGQDIYNQIRSNLLPVLETLSGMFMKYLYPSVKSLWETLSTQLFPALEKLWSVIKEKVLPILAPLVAFLAGALFLALVNIIDIVAQVITVIAKFVAFLLDKLPSMDSFTNSIKMLVDAFKSVWEWGGKAKQYISGSITGVSNWVGSKLPGFANGGIVPGPEGAAQLAIVHGGERVLTAKEAQNGEQNIIFNFNGAVAGDDGIKKIMQQMVGELNRVNNLRRVTP